MSYSLHGKSLLITDGTGSFGKPFVRTALERLDLRKIVVFSRDELKQFEMAQKLTDEQRQRREDRQAEPRRGAVSRS